MTTIEWTDEVWNPVTGCSKVSQGCKNCYAERMARRLQFMKQPRYQNGFNVTLHPDLLEKPGKWKKPKNIFVNSMSDLFHEAVPDEFIFEVFASMMKYDWHTYQILTKRPERMVQFCSNWLATNEQHEMIPKHIWLGTSVENQETIERVAQLLDVPVAVRFLSCEPLLGPIDLTPYLVTGRIHWVIVGGESGPLARVMKAEWAEEVQRQCAAMNVPFFFKQHGGTNKRKTGRELNGQEYNAMPIL